MRKTVVSILAIALAAVVLAVVATQVVARQTAPIGIPADGDLGTLEGVNLLGNVDKGKGELDYAIPCTVDGQLVYVRFPVVIRPLTWVRVSGTAVYVPARVLPNYPEEASIRKYGTYLAPLEEQEPGVRFVVKRDGNRLIAVRAEPISRDGVIRSATAAVGLGTLDFSGSREMTAVIDGWESGPKDRVSIADVNTTARIRGFPVWVRTRANLQPTTVVTVDGRPFDLIEGLESDSDVDSTEPFLSLVRVRLKRVGIQVDLVTLSGTRATYTGPTPGEQGLEGESRIGF